jgi:spore maturation protein CgeB
MRPCRTLGLTWIKIIKIPYAIWFHTNPFRWSNKEFFEYIRSPYCIAFLHDKSFFKDLRELGLKHIFYLPLCSNPKRFKKIDPGNPILQDYRCEVSFAGNLFYKYLEMFEREITSLPEREARLCRAALEKYSGNPLRRFNHIIREVQEETGFTKSLPANFLERLKQALMLASSAKMRKDVVEELQGVDLRIYGGEDWGRVLQGNVNFYGWIDNWDLPKLYNASKINLNITQPELLLGLPMRVFDIPMCEAFLLTDYRPPLEDVFKLGEEIVVFKDLKDLRQKVDYYLTNEGERREIARRGRLRALRDHTFKKRMLFLIDVMRGIYPT